MVVRFNRDMNLKIPITPNWLQPDRSFSGSSKGTPSDSNFEANREADRDAMLKVICSLICENGALKSENKFLRTQLEVREKPFSKEHRLHVNQADCKDNSENKNLEVKVKSWEKKVEDSSSIFNNRFLKPCSYCQEKHIYGYSRCKGYGATCNYCHRINHLEVACTFKYPELRKENVGKFSRNGRMKKKDNCSRNSSRRVSSATSSLDLEIENLENKNSLSRKIANEENETGSHQAQSLVDVQHTELSSNETEVEPSESKIVEEETQIAENDSKTAEFKYDMEHTFARSHKEDELQKDVENKKLQINWMPLAEFECKEKINYVAASRLQISNIEKYRKQETKSEIEAQPQYSESSPSGKSCIEVDGHDGHGHEENFDEVADSLSSGLEAEDSSDPIVAKIEENSSKVENTDESEGYKQTQAVLFWDEDVWAVDQINSTNDINWFEMEHVKEYYTQQSGEILKKFIEKYKTLKKAVTEKEKDLWLASSSAYEKVGQQLLQ